MSKPYSEEFKRRAVDMAKARTASSVARELGCDHTQIDRWAKQFGVTIMKMHRRRWTADEGKIIRRLSGRLPLNAIADKLGRTPQSTLAKMHAMGLSVSVKKNHLSRDEINFIFDNWKNMTCTQISEKLGWSYSTIYSAAKRIGL